MQKIIDRIQIFPPNQIEIFYYEIFDINGQQIKSELKRITSGKDYTAFLDELQTEIDNNSPTPITPKPDWGQFNRLMFSSVSYQRIRNLGNQDAKTLLESFTLSLGVAQKDAAPQDYAFIQLQWGLLVQGLELTAEDIAELNSNVSQANMIFRFDESGAIILN